MLVSHLAPFVKSVKGRAELLSGVAIFNTTITDANGVQVQINLLDRYTDGQLPQVQAEALANRVNVDPIAMPAQYRLAQISEMLYSAMTKSLSPEVSKRLVLRHSEYSFNDNNGHVVYCAACCFFVLVQITDTKTKATVYQAGKRLLMLPSILVELNFKIDDFHAEVDRLEDVLISFGRAVPDLHLNLLEAYKKVPDDEFRQLVNVKTTEFEEGREGTVASLRTTMETKYRSLLQEGVWCAAQRDSDLVALHSRVNALETDRQRGGRGGGGDRGGQQAGRGGRHNGGRGGRGGGGRATGANRSDGRRRRDVAEYPPAWARGNRGPTIQHDGRTYYWCDARGYYCAHRPEDCQAGQTRQGGGSGGGDAARVDNARRIAAIAAGIRHDEE